MQCPTQNELYLDRLLDYVTGAGSQTDRVWMENHVAECLECRQIIEAQRVVWASLDELEPVEISADFNQRLYRRIEQEKEAGFGGRLRRWLAPIVNRPVWSAAAAAGLLAAVLSTQTFIDRPVNSPNVQVAGRNAHVDRETPVVDIEEVESLLEDLEVIEQLVPPVKPAGNSVRL